MSEFDIILRNGLIIDGTGTGEGFYGDVCIAGDKIADIKQANSFHRAKQIIDCNGLVIAPGFIDSHTHDDGALLETPDMLPKLSQGVTTVITGNCGISIAPIKLSRSSPPPPPLDLVIKEQHFAKFEAYLNAVEAAQPAVNVAPLVGHSALRVTVMADHIEKEANESELGEMKKMLTEALHAGAVGFSTGLFYPTNAGATKNEVISLLSEVSKFGGVYATHMRTEGDKILEAIDEALETAKQSKVTLLISHHKCGGVKNWGRTVETLAKISAAAKLQPVYMDVYPYTAASTILRNDFINGTFPVMITRSGTHPEVVGEYLTDIASKWNVSLHEAADRLQPAGGCYFQMDEADVQRVLQHPLAMIGSDGLPFDAHPHPRLWGTFPRVLGHYCKELKLFDLVTAVHKMTGLTAKVFGLKGRGTISVGAFADLVVFDPKSIKDLATYETPIASANGIIAVIVNGSIALAERKTLMKRRSGKVLKRQ